jgi:YVTN family beta-propeller protein
MTRQVLTLLAAAVLSYRPVWGGNCPNPPPPLPPLEGPLPIHWNADMCEEDKNWHYVIINRFQIFGITISQEKNPYYDMNTGKPCCNVGEIVFNPQLRKGHAAGGSDCPSTNESGGAQNTAQSVAADPPPPVPYRSFAIPRLNFGNSPSPTTPQCNSAANPTAFHVVHLDNVVTRINQCTGATIASINVTSNPLEVQVTPDAKWAIVTSYDNAISFIDTSKNTVANVIQTDPDTFPSGVSISPDGSFALVASYINDKPALLVIDVQKQVLTGRIPLPLPFPQSVFLNPDATLAWVTYPFGNTVEVVDVMTGNINQSIQVPQPLDVVFNPTGTTAYISSQVPGSVYAVDTQAYSVLKNIPTGAGASDLLLSPDGPVLVVSNWIDNSISEIDTSGLALIQTIPLGGPPIGLALVPIQ